MNNKIIHLKEMTSTSSYLSQLREEETLLEGTVVSADYQSAGRGQRNNHWESEAGKNLLFSFLFYPDFIKANEQFILSQIVSVAIKRVLDKYTKDISIKWPNDIYWRDKKICGMLIENEIIGDRISSSIAGIGININQDVFHSDAPNPVSLKQILGKEFNKDEMLQEFIFEINRLYDQAKANTESIIALYKISLYRKEGFHLYMDNIGNSFNAIIEDIEPSGLLVLKTERGEIRKFAFKEVKFL